MTIKVKTQHYSIEHNTNEPEDDFQEELVIEAWACDQEQS